MEQCLRITLWVFVLIGCLQAKPTFSGQGDMGYDFLRQYVKCGNVTFTYPEKMQFKCGNEILQHFKDELLHASKKCTDDQNRIDDTLFSLRSEFPLTRTNSPECTLKTKKSNFLVFVDELQSFVEHLHNLSPSDSTDVSSTTIIN